MAKVTDELVIRGNCYKQDKNSNRNSARGSEQYS
jgi:hypothetical protein